jgi:uncharacterized protein (DUF1919 family)
MFNFFKKKITYDPSPKIKVSGTAYITEILMLKADNILAGNKVLFSDRPVEDFRILEMDDIAKFLNQNPEGKIVKHEYGCELQTVRNVEVKAAK